MGRFLRNNRGMALILTILIISLIVALTVEFNRSMRSDLHAAVNLRDGVRFGYVAKSGFNYALAVLIEDASEGNVDSLLDAWADTKSLSENSADLLGDDRFQLTVSDHSGKIQINALVDEQGKYNELQKGLLTRFLQSPEFGVEDEEVDNIVNAIKDWIDADDDPTGFGGAENSTYQTLERPYSCKNAPVEFLQELLLIRGITKEVFYGTKEKPGIASYLSPHGDDGKININTAGALVLKALSDQIDDDMVKDMLEYRRDKANEANLSKVDWYREVLGEMVAIDSNLLTNSSTYFEITSKGFNKGMSKQVTAMVKRKTGEPVPQILSWKIE